MNEWETNILLLLLSLWLFLTIISEKLSLSPRDSL